MLLSDICLSEVCRHGYQAEKAVGQYLELFEYNTRV